MNEKRVGTVKDSTVFIKNTEENLVSNSNLFENEFLTEYFWGLTSNPMIVNRNVLGD